MSEPMFQMENLCANIYAADTYKKRVKVAADFCVERQRVYLKKTASLPRPWTTDPILQYGRFTNIYRELDKVTVQIMDNWIKPNIDNPNLVALSVLGRVINKPSTLDVLLPFANDFSPKKQARIFAEFNRIKESGERLVTGAYIVNTIFRKDSVKIDGSKADYIANELIPDLWAKRKDLQESLKSNSYHTVIEAIRTVHGVGAFISNQAAADLSYTKWLRKAKDIDTTWNPGPGTMKGIKYVTGDTSLKPGTDKVCAALQQYHHDLNAIVAKNKFFTGNMHTGMAVISGPNASNSLCELSKWSAMALGSRNRMKNRYKGV
jgi:hypothetical protein